MSLYNSAVGHFSFFRNKEIDALYLTHSLISFAGGLAGVFVPIYLWQLGEPMWRILFFFFVQALSFVVLVLILIPVIKRLNDKLLMLYAIPFLVLYYYGFNFYSFSPALFYILPILHSFAAIFFNTGYHIDFAGSADADSLGREIGALHLITSLVSLSAPLLGGFIIAFLGFFSVFGLSAGLLVLAVLPLFFFPRRTVSPDVSNKSVFNYLLDKRLIPFTVSGAGYAMETIVGAVVWPLFMFMVLGSIKELGGVISAGFLVGSIITFITGFVSDAGRRRKVITYSSFASSLVWFLRAFFQIPSAVISSQIIGHAVGSSLMVGWTSHYYKIARVLPSGISFILSRELLYNLARLPFIAIIMFLSVYLSLQSFFMAAFIVGSILALSFILANKVHTSTLGNPAS